jgi:glycosyltransferase involved in cell wall biosynthesis
MYKSGLGDVEATVSACMIVKSAGDEEDERLLTQALESIKDFVDEIIFVDTGSKGRAIEIARSFGAVVYEHTWDPWDFSAARNKAMEYCTKEWIFIIDLDEKLMFAPGATPRMMKLWLGGMPKEKNGGAIVLHDIQKNKVAMRMNTARFFRKGHVKYEQIIHNAPQLEGGGYYCNITGINHYGYDLSPEKMNLKELRTRGGLFKRLEQDPTDYLAYFYLCQLCAVCDKPEEAILYAKKYVEHKEELGPEKFNPCIYYTMIHNYLALKKVDEANECLTAGLQMIPEDLDLAFAETELGVFASDKDKVWRGARRYLKWYEEYQKHPETGEGRFMYTNSPEAKGFVTFNLIQCGLMEGFGNIKILEQTLPECEESMRNELISNLATVLKQFGIEMEVKFTDVPKPDGVGLPSQEILKQLEV